MSDYWRPISTAPKDGTAILAFGQLAGEISGVLPGERATVADWRGGSTDYPGFDWFVCDCDAYAVWVKPTHWQPLPRPPLKHSGDPE